MKRITLFVVAATFLLSGCVNQKQVSEEEKRDKEEVRDEVREGDLRNPGGAYDVQEEAEESQRQRKQSIQELDQQEQQQQQESETED